MKSEKEKLSPSTESPNLPMEDKKPARGQSNSTKTSKPAERPNYLLRLL